MYDYIKGTLISKLVSNTKSASIVVENNGIGYQINTTSRNVALAGEEGIEFLC